MIELCTYLSEPSAGVEWIAKDVVNLVPVQNPHPLAPRIRTSSLEYQENQEYQECQEINSEFSRKCRNWSQSRLRAKPPSTRPKDSN